MPARLAAALGLVIVLAGCSSPAPAPVDTPPTPRETAAATPPESGFDPDASATESLAYFNSIVAPLASRDGLPKGGDVIDALAEAGFDRAAMELTPDTTAVGLDADSIEFSVKVDGECILGQFGSFGFRSEVMPLLDTGTCLVGATKEIAG